MGSPVTRFEIADAPTDASRFTVEDAKPDYSDNLARSAKPTKFEQENSSVPRNFVRGVGESVHKIGQNLEHMNPIEAGMSMVGGGGMTDIQPPAPGKEFKWSDAKPSIRNVGRSLVDDIAPGKDLSEKGANAATLPLTALMAGRDVPIQGQFPHYNPPEQVPFSMSRATGRSAAGAAVDLLSPHPSPSRAAMTAGVGLASEVLPWAATKAARSQPVVDFLTRKGGPRSTAPAREPLWKQAGIQEGKPEPNVSVTQVPEPTARTKSVPAARSPLWKDVEAEGHGEPNVQVTHPPEPTARPHREPSATPQLESAGDTATRLAGQPKNTVPVVSTVEPFARRALPEARPMAEHEERGAFYDSNYKPDSTQNRLDIGKTHLKSLSDELGLEDDEEAASVVQNTVAKKLKMKPEDMDEIGTRDAMINKGVPINEALITDPSKVLTHFPSDMDQEGVIGMTAAMRRGEDMPPVEILRIGNKMYLLDGQHRTTAAGRSGMPLDASVYNLNQFEDMARAKKQNKPPTPPNLPKLKGGNLPIPDVHKDAFQRFVKSGGKEGPLARQTKKPAPEPVKPPTASRRPDMQDDQAVKQEIEQRTQVRPKEPGRKGKAELAADMKAGKPPSKPVKKSLMDELSDGGQQSELNDASRQGMESVLEDEREEVNKHPLSGPTKNMYDMLDMVPKPSTESQALMKKYGYKQNNEGGLSWTKGRMDGNDYLEWDINGNFYNHNEPDMPHQHPRNLEEYLKNRHEGKK